MMTNVPIEPVISPVLIGRASELKTLHQLIDLAKNGAGQALLISGEAGIGKSRLVQEGVHYAVDQGFLVLKGCCFPPDTNCPYAPIVDLLRVYFDDDRNDNTASRSLLQHEQFPLLPEIIPVSSDAGFAHLLEPEQEKRRLFAVLIQMVRQQAEQQPVFFLIEDVHWSDSCSLEFLHQLIRRCAMQHIIIVLTFRSEDSPQLRPWLAQLDRGHLIQELRITPLALSDVKEMLASLLANSSLLRTDALNIIFEVTDGNPFFIEELLKSLRESGTLTHLTDGELHLSILASGRIPRTVKTAVQERFERLSDDARQTASLAAVIGRRFNFSLLQALTQWPEFELIRTLKELVAAYLIVEEAPDSYVFRHALTQQAVYETLLGRERKTLHQRIAEMIESLYANSPSFHTEDLARHFHIVGNWEKSLKYSVAAGEQSLQLYDPNTAIKHFTQALDAGQHLDRRLPLLYQKRGQIYELLGNFDKAYSDLQSALDLARQEHDYRAEWQTLIALGFLWSSRSYGKTGEFYQQALKLAQTIGDPAILAQTLNRLGNWHLNIEEPHEAQRYHQEALVIFQRLNAVEGMADTLDLLGIANSLGGDLVRGAEYLTRAATGFRDLDNRIALCSSQATLTLSGMTYQTNTMIAPDGTLAAVIQSGEAALRVAQDNRLRSSEVYAWCTLAFCLGSAGEYDRGLIATKQAIVQAEEIGHRQWTIFAHAANGALYWDVLHTVRAQEHLQKALVIAREVGSLHWLRTTTGFLASAYLIDSDTTQAKTVLEAVLTPSMPAQTVGQRLCWMAYAELALALNDLDTALDITEKLLVSAENRPTGTVPVVPRVSLLRGQIFTRLGRYEEAMADLLAVQGVVTRHGAQPLLWRTQIALGKLYLAQGRGSEAEDEFFRAHTIIDELAAKLPDEADETLRAQFLTRATAAIPPLSPQQRVKKTFGGLTSRERDVAALVTQGKSNREIADMLVISERTIETHISNIFNKLSFSSRAQIAVWATQKGLLRPGE